MNSPSDAGGLPDRRILVISTAPVGELMSGVGIRALELARVLTSCGSVTIAAPDSAPGERDGITIRSYVHRSPGALRPLIDAADVVIAQPQWPSVASWLRRSDARVVFDLYDPEIFENLEHFTEEPSRLSGLWTTLTLDRLTMALHRGDMFVCATEAQRDLWIGTMLAERLIGTSEYARDPTLARRITTVPFGVPDTPCVALGPSIQEVVPSVPPDARVILWNGGLWSWLDPLTPIRAVGVLRRRYPDAHLVFMGASSHPAAARAADAARDLASSLGLLNDGVHFNTSWVPYAERSAFLLGAECSVSAHHDHLETRFAFRTRVLDCFWSGLPIVCTRGDALSDYVDRRGLGAAVAPGDVEAMATAIGDVLDRGRASYGAALAAAAEVHSWSKVAHPIVDFINNDDARATVRRSHVPLAVQVRSRAYRAALVGVNVVRRDRTAPSA